MCLFDNQSFDSLRKRRSEVERDAATQGMSNQVRPPNIQRVKYSQHVTRERLRVVPRYRTAALSMTPQV